MCRATTSHGAWRGLNIRRRVEPAAISGSQPIATASITSRFRDMALRIGTLVAVLSELESHHHLDRWALMALLVH